MGCWNLECSHPEPTPDHVLPWFPYRTAQKWAEENGIPRIDFSEVFHNIKVPKVIVYRQYAS